MTNNARLQAIRTAVDQIANDEHRVNCACVIASGEDNANNTLGWDDGATEEWCNLAIRSIESLLESQPTAIQDFFKHLGFNW